MTNEERQALNPVLVLVKIPADAAIWREPGLPGEFRYGQLELLSDGSYTYWPLPSYGLRRGSYSKGAIHFPFRVVWRAAERRKWEAYAERAEANQPRMQFHCQRCPDGSVEVQNIVVGEYIAPMMGQRHTHTAEEFEVWKAKAIAEGHKESDFIEGE